MSINTVPEDHSQPEGTSSWNQIVLEYQEEENKLNPLPPVQGPIVRDRQSYVPDGVKKYMERRYGPGIEVDVGSRFGNENGSGYSYNVWLRNDKDVTRLAEMSANRMLIPMLPPNYNGYLKEEMQKIREENMGLTPSSRPKELERTLWVMSESPKAQQMRHAQVQSLKASIPNL